MDGDEDGAIPAAVAAAAQRQRRPVRGTSSYDHDGDWEMAREVRGRERAEPRHIGRVRPASTHTWRPASADDDDDDFQPPSKLRKHIRPSPKNASKRRRPAAGDLSDAGGSSRPAAKRRRRRRVGRRFPPAPAGAAAAAGE